MSQHDFTIANQTASSARSDINNALQALATNNSGASAPSTTYANMWWYDTGVNILKQRNEANTAWVNVGYINPSTNKFEILNDTKVVTTSGTQVGILGNQSTATWETGTGTTETLVSPAKVKAAIDSSTPTNVGEVGTYAFLYDTRVTAVNQGVTTSGSNLRYANAFQYGGKGYRDVAPSGTWRCMGASGYYENQDYSTQSDKRTTLWLRTS